jgi:hypothetical protein
LKYPITCYGRVFNNSTELQDYTDGLMLFMKSKPSFELIKFDYLTVKHCYDNGFLNHPDYKYLMKIWPKQ